jgi:hypothetical protein
VQFGISVVLLVLALLRLRRVLFKPVRTKAMLLLLELEILERRRDDELLFLDVDGVADAKVAIEREAEEVTSFF